MQSQNWSCFQRFLVSQWEKLASISLKTGLKWEEKYSCTKAKSNPGLDTAAVEQYSLHIETSPPTRPAGN